ncbi:MAG TPA: cytochrome c [Bacteroidia bacterium]|nr:cytochrome c [Bacteroidia bacterium]
MYKSIVYTHLISVNLFLLIYLIKTILLVANKEEGLAKFIKTVKVPEMIISVLFLITGIYMLTQIPAISTLLIIKILVVFASIPVAVIGFKKKNKALAILSFIMIVGAYGMAEVSKKRSSMPAPAENTTTGDVSQVADGKMIFESNCMKCHGEDGTLGLMDATNLATSTMDIQARVEIIKQGKGATMPAFEGQLTEEQIQAVATYLETLKK